MVFCLGRVIFVLSPRTKNASHCQPATLRPQTRRCRASPEEFKGVSWRLIELTASTVVMEPLKDVQHSIVAQTFTSNTARCCLRISVCAVCYKKKYWYVLACLSLVDVYSPGGKKLSHHLESPNVFNSDLGQPGQPPPPRSSGLLMTFDKDHLGLAGRFVLKWMGFNQFLWAVLERNNKRLTIIKYHTSMFNGRIAAIFRLWILGQTMWNFWHPFLQASQFLGQHSTNSTYNIM